MKKKTRIKILAMMCLMMSLFWWRTLSAHAAEPDFTDCSKLVEAVTTANATERPNPDSKVIYTFKQGTPVLVTGESPDGWYRITFQGQEGYVSFDAVKEAVVVEGEEIVAEELIPQLDKELDEMEQTNKIIVEEVERLRAEKKRSVLWTAVIVVLIAGIFGVGIYSTIKANREKDEGENTDDSTDTA